MTATVVCTVREASVVDKSRKVLSVCWWLQVLFSSCCACRTDLTQVLHSTIIQLHVLNSTVQALPSICAPDVINCITRAGLLSKVSLCYCAVACSESLAISSKSGCESTAGCKRPRAHCCFLLAVEPERLGQHGAQITISFLDHQPLLYVIAATSGKLAGPPSRLRGLECHVSWLVSARVCAYVQVCVEVLNKQRGFGSGWALVKIMWKLPARHKTDSSLVYFNIADLLPAAC